MTRHELGAEWLIDHAAGTLSAGQSMFVASCLAMHPGTRNDVRAAAEIGGTMLDALAPDTLSADALSRILASLDDMPPTSPAARSADPVPTEVRSLIEGTSDKLNWRFLVPGLARVPLWQNGDEKLWLMRAMPGSELPIHGHRGAELTLVLKGSFADAHNSFTRGDVQECNDEVEHSLTVGPDEVCICLLLTKGRLRFKSLLARATALIIRI